MVNQGRRILVVNIGLIGRRDGARRAHDGLGAVPVDLTAGGV
jgi:hypothetical protein